MSGTMSQDDVPRSVKAGSSKNTPNVSHPYDGSELPEMTYTNVDIIGVGVISVAGIPSLEVDLYHQDLQDDSETEPQKEVDPTAKVAPHYLGGTEMEGVDNDETSSKEKEVRY